MGTGIGKCIRECKRGVTEFVNGCSTVMDITSGEIVIVDYCGCQPRYPQSRQLPITEDQCPSKQTRFAAPYIAFFSFSSLSVDERCAELREPREGGPAEGCVRGELAGVITQQHT